MMLRWYAENPKDGSRIARAIRVGISLKETRKGLLQDEVWGDPVPEADREVTQ